MKHVVLALGVMVCMMGFMGLRAAPSLAAYGDDCSNFSGYYGFSQSITNSGGNSNYQFTGTADCSTPLTGSGTADGAALSSTAVMISGTGTAGVSGCPTDPQITLQGQLTFYPEDGSASYTLGSAVALTIEPGNEGGEGTMSNVDGSSAVLDADADMGATGGSACVLSQYFNGVSVDGSFNQEDASVGSAENPTGTGGLVEDNAPTDPTGAGNTASEEYNNTAIPDTPADATINSVAGAAPCQAIFSVDTTLTPPATNCQDGYVCRLAAKSVYQTPPPGYAGPLALTGTATDNPCRGTNVTVEEITACITQLNGYPINPDNSQYYDIRYCKTTDRDSPDGQAGTLVAPVSSQCYGAKGSWRSYYRVYALGSITDPNGDPETLHQGTYGPVFHTNC